MRTIKTNCMLWLKRECAVTMLLWLFLFILFNVFGFMPSFAQVVAVNPPTGGFSINGKLKADGAAGDWVAGAGTGGFVLNNDGTPVNANTTGLSRDLFNSSSDQIFSNGSKFNDYVSALRWSTGTATSKDDINNGMYHVSVAPGNDHQWLFIAGDRLSTNGTSYIDFELLQGTISVNNGGTFSGSGAAGGRTSGDIDISMEYTNGGSKPNVVIYRWNKNASNVWFWDSTGSAALSQNNYAFAETNRTGTAGVPFGAFGANNTTYQQFAFVEAGIDVTQLLGNLQSCSGITIKTVWIKTKAAATSAAALKDFMSPISVNFEFTPAHITAVSPLCADADPVCLSGTPSGGTFSGTGVVADNTCASGYKFDPSAAGVKKGDGSAGDNTITYSVTISGSCLSQPTATVHVNAKPSVTVNSPTKCAGDAAVTISATPLPAPNGTTITYDYSWTVPAGFTDPGNVQSFTSSVDGDYTVVITRAGTGCTGTGMGHLTVNANPGKPALDVVNPTCSNTTGTVTVTSPVDDATHDYEYSNNGGAWQDDVSFTIAGGAGYSIVARNKATQCTSSAQTGTMGVATATPDATAIITQNVDCSHSHGTVRIMQASTGNPAYSTTDFEFSNDGTNYGSSDAFDFVAGGGYHLYVRRKLDHTCIKDVSCAGEVQSGANRQSLVDVPVEIGPKTSVLAAPNPFNDRIRFSVKSSVSGQGRLELYNMLGQKVKTVFEGNITAGQIQNIEYTVPGSQRANLIYVFTVGGERTSGKLINLSR